MAKLNAYSTKAEEVDALRKIAAQFPEGTYLHSLLNEKLMTWVEGMIRDDFMPDLFGAVEDLTQQLQDSRSQCNAEHIRATEANKTISLLNEALDDLRGSHATEVEDLKAKIARANDQISIANEIANAVRMDLNSRDDEVEDLRAQVTRLKVEIYDLTHTS